MNFCGIVQRDIAYQNLLHVGRENHWKLQEFAICQNCVLHTHFSSEKTHLGWFNGLTFSSDLCSLVFWPVSTASLYKLFSQILREISRIEKLSLLTLFNGLSEQIWPLISERGLRQPPRFDLIRFDVLQTHLGSFSLASVLFNIQRLQWWNQKPCCGR